MPDFGTTPQRHKCEKAAFHQGFLRIRGTGFGPLSMIGDLQASFALQARLLLADLFDGVRAFG